MSDPRLAPREQAVVQAAVTAGWLSPADVDAAIALRDAQRAAGRPALLLPILAQRLSPDQLAHLRGVHQTGRLPPALIDSSERARLIGRYRVIRELGEGGMGAVYLAQEPELDRQVALKVVLPGASAQTIERTRVEAQAAAKLDHPGIVRLHTVERDAQGRLVIALEVISGGSLADRLKREGPLPPHEAAALLAKVARAIEYAHDRGILHRDLKPANILLTEDGEPKVTDFGLAKEQDDDQGLTKTGVVMGSPGYMSPEQGAGERARIDARTDVYGLGATLFALLTGQPPFQGSLMVIISRLLTKDAPTARSLNPEVDPTLSGICAAALAREPDDRTASAGELAEQLEAYLAGARAPSQAPLIAILVVGVLGLVGALAGAIALRRPPQTPASIASQTPKPTPTETAAPVDPADPDTWPVRFTLDGPTLMSDRLPALEVWGTRLVSRDGAGIRIRATAQTTAEVMLPLEYSGGAFQLELEGRIVLLERSNRISITFHPWPDGARGPNWPIPLAFAVRGQRRSRQAAPEDALWLPTLFADEAQTVAKQERSRDAPLRVKLRYDPKGDAPRFHLEVRLGGGPPLVRSGTLAKPLPPGPYRLRLGANLRPRRETKAGHGYAYDEGALRGHNGLARVHPDALCDVRALRLRLRALVDGVVQEPASAPRSLTAYLGRLRRAVTARAKLEATAEALATLASGKAPEGLPMPEFDKMASARYALTHAYERLGRTQAAAETHHRLHEGFLLQDPAGKTPVITSWYHATWSRELLAADSKTLEALSRAYPKWKLSQEPPAERISRLFERSRPINDTELILSGMQRPVSRAAASALAKRLRYYLNQFRAAELLVLLHAHPDHARPGSLARLWFVVGDLQRALTYIEQVEPVDRMDAVLIARATFRLARFRECAKILAAHPEAATVRPLDLILPVARRLAAR